MTRKVSPYSPDTPPPLLCPELSPVSLSHENPWFKVVLRGSYYSIEYERPQVVILPVLEGHSIVMVRVDRPLIHDHPLELPAGDSKDGETPRMAAMREFAEETGIHIKDPLRFVAELPISEMPGRFPVLLSVLRVNVTKSEFDSRSRYDNEIASVKAIPFIEVARKLVSGEIYLSSPAAIISRFLLKTCLDGSMLGKEPR